MMLSAREERAAVRNMIEDLKASLEVSDEYVEHASACTAWPLGTIWSERNGCDCPYEGLKESNRQILNRAHDTLQKLEERGAVYAHRAEVSQCR